MRISRPACWPKAKPAGRRPKLCSIGSICRSGGRAVDFGCGPLGVLDVLALRVDSGGETFTQQPLLFEVWGRKPG
jgi:hypothetical protein